MVANLDGLEAELERLARIEQVVIHRSPPPDLQTTRIGYYICDYNNVVLFPQSPMAQSQGATVQETHHWLWNHRSSLAPRCRVRH